MWFAFFPFLSIKTVQRHKGWQGTLVGACNNNLLLLLLRAPVCSVRVVIGQPQCQ
jgi:hypothetical protein